MSNIRYRIQKDDKFQGGEWLDHASANDWAQRQVGGNYRIVECDIYGNPISELIPTTFRIVKFPKVSTPNYVGIAWNYDHAILISTPPCADAADTREMLAQELQKVGAHLRWFEGLYECTDGVYLVPAPSK